MWTNKELDPNEDVQITVYGSTHRYTRRKALDFFYECMLMSEGAERERYVNIITELMSGKTTIRA